MDGKILRFRREPNVRCLRQYNRIADKSYSCFECDQNIMPGEWYFASIFVCGKRLWVERRHLPECPEDPLKREHEAEAVETERQRGLAA